MDLMRYPQGERDQLANCMLLTQQENGAGGKSDTPPDQWFVGGRAEDTYLNMHLIPHDSALWKLDRFDDFIKERKKLIAEKFKSLLVSADYPNTIRLEDLFGSIGDRVKSVSKLIDAGLVLEQAPLVLRYQGQDFTGKAHREGIELTDGTVYAPSSAAIRCYEIAGSPRPTENGWRVWKTAEGRTLNDLYEQLHTRQSN